ncbi:PilT/PilU family type 4a pilus ATPase [Anaerovorax odorimutans]|uniref:PilT/PilU family type 4a pilus ATPase n=1 Tax=Anaerovorax odorimutans TaxID=109327 RepID=A0ABT1RQR0_9FIRM|nr:PilT/PilU family type 4a pilus ATPase [Anaerovorax odorimutans]MCQ4637501.1 PilT/PilU family type 4a pilus ATPase [Anaerovorax odorimutans]
MNITDVLKDASEKNASDIFIIAGRPLGFKINSRIVNYSDQMLMPKQTKELIFEIYGLAGGRETEKLLRSGDDDFSFAIAGIARFRASIYKQRGSLAAVIRVISFDLPDPDKMHIPSQVMDTAKYTKGLVLITGPSGSGKSVTLACLIDRINSTRNSHIITLEEPIEFLHPHKMSIVSQREISLDTESYLTALRASLRQTPDVILLGELRDPETINVAMTAAETGHLVISTLHTLGAANTIDRIVDNFPSQKQPQIRLQLSMVLQAVISQQLLVAEDSSLIPAFELMKATPAVRTMIRDAKTHQIESAIHSGAKDGMISMDSSLIELYQSGMIDKHTAAAHSFSPDAFARKL